jgi:glycosyltransferase involved in cell wall biosynthesis
MKEREIIVVLGMHRSGTSAITRSLDLLGVELGDSLHPASADNPKGFWEDNECLQINEELLALLNSSYDRLAFTWNSFKDLPQIKLLRLKAAQLIESRLMTTPGIWGFKDPRTCRLLSFWQEVFRTTNCKASYIIALRNPASIADSLESRNAIPAEKSYLLWLQHILPATLQTKGENRVIVDFDEFLDSPYKQLCRIATSIGLKLPSQDDPKVLELISDFLDRELRHSRYTHETLSIDARANKLVIETHRLLELSARDEANFDLDSIDGQLQVVQQELKQFSPAFDYINLLEDERQQLWLSSADLQSQRAYLAEENSELAEEVKAVNQRNSELEMESLQLLEENRKLSNDNSAIALRNDELAGLSQRASDLEREIHQILTSSSWRITKPLRLIRRVFHWLLSGRRRSALRTLAFALWHRLPLKSSNKANLKRFLFNNFPLLFKNLAAYKRWHEFNGIAHEPLIATRSTVSPGESAYVPILQAAAPKSLPARVIAFYLPQFHAIKENNEWWGEGFTEWTNVRPAKPQFEGHYQPHLPGELGYYSLLDRSTQQRQIELAKLYGIAGFCFYYYWFGGKRLLEKPIENYLADPALDHPFCLCWANENWSRRWDGKDSEILIAQQHSTEDDLAFAADVARYMRDPRYIRINGKPLLIVYRPSLLPSALDTSLRWREWFREAGLGEIYLAYTQSFEAEDPRQFGFDAAIEFPPNNSAPPNITSSVQPLNKAFTGTVYDWSALAKRSFNYQQTPYKLFRSVCPSWDNTARRKNNSTVFLNSTPALYQQWLENAVAETCAMNTSTDERLVFVNAWNEWAEGAHLEPDQKYGYAWLDATRKALTGEPAGPFHEQIAVISHDAHPHGAQFLALGMVRSLAQDFKFGVHTVLLGEGRLRENFTQYSNVYDLHAGADFDARAARLAEELAAAGVSRAIVNTTVSGTLVKALVEQDIICTSLIHEMPGVIQANNLQPQAKSIAAHAHHVVFPAQIVGEGFSQFADVDREKAAIRPQGLWRRNLQRHRKSKVRKELREKLGVANEVPLILAVGYADHRKGVDLFSRAALEVLAQKPDALFVWIGHWDDKMRLEVAEITKGHESSFRFLGYEPNTAAYHAAADVYALTSREDPFPNVVLESFDAGVPVVAFAGTGGGAELASRIGGIVVPSQDTRAFALALLELLDKPQIAQTLGAQASQLVDEQYAFRAYLFDLCSQSGLRLPKVSVVVPNFNYARYIHSRLDSIIDQTLPIYELIILDDASTDNSVEEICSWLEQHNVECRMVVNEKNSGCVFDQWAKGIYLATGDYIWIAEADDLAGPEFLNTVIAPMERDSDVVLSFCESQQIDQNGLRLAVDYQEYRNDICTEHWDIEYTNAGQDEITQYLAVKNTIPNVSAVVFRRDAIEQTFAKHLERIRSLTKAGDWLVYVKVLQAGKIAFNPRPMNLHRRHSTSVIGASGASTLLDQVAAVQREVANTYPLPASSAARAESYLQELKTSLSGEKRIEKGMA